MTPTLPRRKIGPFEVPAIGFGCMNLSHAYGRPPAPERARAVLHAALDAGVTLFDTAALYGFGANETLVGPELAPHRGRIVLCSKGGMAGVAFPEGVKRVIDGRPEAIRRNCEDSLRRLGTDHIDLYYLHRWDKSVPVEDSVGELVRLKAEGKIGALGLSEVSAGTIRRAHAVHPIAAVQSEYSLWSRNAEIAVLQTCADIGAAFVAFSPVARGVLTAEPPDPAAFDPKDIRRAMPRFDAAHYASNLKLAAAHRSLAREAGCTPAQLALAWLLRRGPHVLPLPGTTSVAHLKDNMAALQVRLGDDVVGRLDALFDPRAVSGTRYNEQNSREVDTEEFPA
jgi:aryl-alcohol dehydrogenase-like predicted oxidoreductase